MKTAMQELIELLELNDKNKPMPYIIDSIEQVYISKEKKQIMNAYLAGFTDGYHKTTINDEEYYNNNFNQNEDDENLKFY